jgi:hypothetical protein
MAEKAVDERAAVSPLNAFNAVTSRTHPSPSHQNSDGGGVFASVPLRGNPGEVPGGPAAMVPADGRIQP